MALTDNEMRSLRAINLLSIKSDMGSGVSGNTKALFESTSQNLLPEMNAPFILMSNHKVPLPLPFSDTGAEFELCAGTLMAYVPAEFITPLLSDADYRLAVKTKQNYLLIIAGFYRNHYGQVIEFRDKIISLLEKPHMNARLVEDEILQLPSLGDIISRVQIKAENRTINNKNKDMKIKQLEQSLADCKKAMSAKQQSNAGKS